MKRWWVWLFVAWVGLDVWLVRWWLDERREQRAEPFVQAAARQYGVETSLIRAVIWRESRFHPDARGRAGELGLMQVGNLAGIEWAERESIRGHVHQDLLNPGKNTLAGTYYLSRMLARYQNTDNPTVYALADYNAGRSNVLRWLNGAAATNSAAFLEAMDFPGTRRYIQAIVARRDHYRAQPAYVGN